MTAALEGSAACPGRALPRERPGTHLQEAGWAPEPVWTGGKSRPTRIRSPERPARSSVAIPTELPGPYFPCRTAHISLVPKLVHALLLNCFVVNFNIQRLCPYIWALMFAACLLAALWDIREDAKLSNTTSEHRPQKTSCSFPQKRLHVVTWKNFGFMFVVILL